MRRFAMLALCLLTGLAPSLAQGEAQERAPTAVLVVPRGEDVVVREIVARLRGELSASGFAVSMVERDNLARPREEIERTAGESSATAVIVVRPEQATVPFVDLWISDRVLGATSNLHLSSDHPDPSERARRLSVQAVEVLRARLAELLLAPGNPSPAAPREAPQEPARQASVEHPTPRRPHLELGVGPALTHARALSATRWMPLVDVLWSWSRAIEHAPRLALAVGAFATGFARSVEKSGARGTARVAQGWGVVQLMLRLASWFPLAPEVSLSAGAYGVSVEGDTEPPYEAQRVRGFSPLLGGGVGVRARLLPRLSLRAVNDALYASRRSSIRVADEQVARAGGLLLTLRLELSVVLW